MLYVNVSPDSLNGIVNVNIKGKIDTIGNDILKTKIEPYLEDAVFQKIIINLKDCDFITSVGLGALVGLHKKAEETGKKIIFTELHKNVESIFKITNLYNFFNIE